MLHQAIYKNLNLYYAASACRALTDEPSSPSAGSAVLELDSLWGLICQDGKHRSLRELAGWAVCRGRPPPSKGTAAARRCRHVREPPPLRRSTSCSVEHGLEKQYCLWAGTLTSPRATRHADLGAKALCPARPSQSRFERSPLPLSMRLHIAQTWCTEHVFGYIFWIRKKLSLSRELNSERKLWQHVWLAAVGCPEVLCDGARGLAAAIVCACFSSLENPSNRRAFESDYFSGIPLFQHGPAAESREPCCATGLRTATTITSGMHSRTTSSGHSASPMLTP